ncbi:Na+/H+ antiporter [Campylobacter concisus]|uniref:Na+/H+ antiporter n=1 Tax=Campylobacter concisus TaxID=199 RepID=UPI00122CD25B|nr:Na+/H+ antiporter [Campylobacter concisus]
MIEHLLLFFALLAIIIALVMVSNRLKVAYPVLLVLGGLAISFVPNLPSIKIDPELIFIIFLPPLLYEAAWANSLKELFKWRRMIGSFAFIVVFISAAAVAVIANLVIPGFSLALGFMLGAIVSPPDAVSTAAILKFVKAPRRISAILEGESLLNDASSLIIFRFAAVAVTTGQFVWYKAATTFLWMVAGGVLAGLVVALAAYFLHKILPTDENSDTIMTITTPYIMYILAEELGASGVLAVVCGGLYLSTKKNEIFTASTRIHAVPVWNNFIFLLNGLAFTMIGLDLPEILSGLKRSGVSLFEAISYGILVTAVLIVIRLIASYGAVYITMFMKRYISVADDRNPGKATPFIVGWAGMRGVVSLAAALSIPAMAGGEPFPHRDLILFITFVVILLTLVVQGLSLPMLIKSVKFPDFNDHMPNELARIKIKKALAQASLKFKKEKFTGDEHFLFQKLEEVWNFELESENFEISDEARQRYFEILEEQRKALCELNKDPKIDEEVIRTFLYHIDLEEQRWRAHSEH